MKIITLVENTRIDNSALEAKHGLSLYIETANRKLLFDIGPDNSAINNAQAMGIDLSMVEMLILSHAHYDHGRGLADFFKINSKAAVYLLSDCNDQYFSKQKDDSYKPIGLDVELFSQYPKRFHFFDHKLRLSDNMMLLAPTIHSTFQPRNNANLYTLENGLYSRDRFQHELILTVMEHGSLIIFTGCAHSGILNMILSVEGEFPGVPIQTVIGGFHLANPRDMKLAEEQETVVEIGSSLLKHQIQKIYTGHCTGEEGFSLLQTILQDRIQKLTTGSIIHT
jgi:7,8-dihydropterin-6-yl-methyl-4-(beta-D-ribofuranosyl)aminobenzene 5'-phosphate synthase